MKRLDGRIAIISGAGQQPGDTIGNGRAVAELFAREGATLLLVDLNEDWANGTLEAIRSTGGTASVVRADVSTEDDCRAVVAACKDRYGRVDILHNNVGVVAGDAPTVELDVAMWDRLMAVNVRSMFLMAKHVLPVMIAQGSGCILNITSIASVAAMSTVAYKTSKGAVNTLTHHLAIENAKHGIRVNAVMPGVIDTPIAVQRRVSLGNNSIEDIRRERAARVPLGFQGTAQDIANACLFLASEEARYITGVVLPVDGGLICKVG